MATKTTMLYEHTCDLCGEVRAADELTSLHGEPGKGRRSLAAMMASPTGRKVDICPDCRSRPVGDVFDLLAG